MDSFLCAAGDIEINIEFTKRLGAGFFGGEGFILERLEGSGEHGPHGIRLGPDGLLYVIAGNFTKVPAGLDPESPHRNYADDLAIQRIEDGNGFGAGKQPPGGFVTRVDLDGKNVKRLTNEIGYDGGPFWSYDSQWIVFRANHPKTEKDIAEYRALLCRASFTLTRVVSTPAGPSVVEAVPV